MIKKEISPFNDYANEYATKLGDISLYQKHIETFAELLQPSAHIIDLGCGPCRISTHIYKQRNDVTFDCVDISPAMIDIAKTVLPQANFTVCDLTTYNFEKKYDGVMCSFALPFLTKVQIEVFIEKITHAVEKDGIIYISTMQGNSEGFEKTSFSKEAEVYFIYHQKEFLDELFSIHNLEVLEYHEQVYPQDHADDLSDMIYILKKVER